MLVSAALQAHKESACGVTIQAYSPANQPRTAALQVQQKKWISVYFHNCKVSIHDTALSQSSLSLVP